ncbi:heterogeneous nuclear ribonucleoprotein L-like [Saccostrea cucullata]|uniref:heterogeneous nuclear ribonucleoprotein L-like n=1 Tax=Saccostrea cuccullata TaxID=36930 RepID=UPI002ED5BA7F
MIGIGMSVKISKTKEVKMASGYEGHVSKRQRRDNDENPLNPSPSQVVHVRGLAENILEQDLKDAVQQFGTVSYIVLMPRKHQALVEFEVSIIILT